MLDVSILVHQMHDTLSQIHETISSLDTKSHDDKLDALEAKREGLFEQIQAAYQKQSEELGQLRQARRDDVAEQRRREDEEIAARRKREDDELQSLCLSEDSERERKLEGEKMSVEEETERQMAEIELEAQRIHDEGHKKIGDLERKRREINSLIDEHMKAPLPPPPTRRRRGTRAAPAQNVPALPSTSAEAPRPEPQSSPRGISPQEPTSSAEFKGQSKETVPKEAAAERNILKETGLEETIPKETTLKETVLEETLPKATVLELTSTNDHISKATSREEAVPDKSHDAPAMQDESLLDSTTREVSPKEAKPDSDSREQSPSEEDVPQGSGPQVEIISPEVASDKKTAVSDPPMTQEYQSREIALDSDPMDHSTSNVDKVQESLASTGPIGHQATDDEETSPNTQPEDHEGSNEELRDRVVETESEQGSDEYHNAKIAEDESDAVARRADEPRVVLEMTNSPEKLNVVDDVKVQSSTVDPQDVVDQNISLEAVESKPHPAKHHNVYEDSTAVGQQTYDRQQLAQGVTDSKDSTEVRNVKAEPSSVHLQVDELREPASLIADAEPESAEPFGIEASPAPSDDMDGAHATGGDAASEVTATQSRSAEKPISALAQADLQPQDKNSSQNEPAPEFNTKNGAAEEYMQMSSDKSESNREHGAPELVNFAGGEHDLHTRDLDRISGADSEQLSYIEQRPSEGGMYASGQFASRDVASSDVVKDIAADIAKHSSEYEPETVSYNEKSTPHGLVHLTEQSNSRGEAGRVVHLSGTHSSEEVPHKLSAADELPPRGTIEFSTKSESLDMADHEAFKESIDPAPKADSNIGSPAQSKHDDALLDAYADTRPSGDAIQATQIFSESQAYDVEDGIAVDSGDGKLSNSSVPIDHDNESALRDVGQTPTSPSQSPTDSAVPSKPDEQVHFDHVDDGSREYRGFSNTNATETQLPSDQVSFDYQTNIASSARDMVEQHSSGKLAHQEELVADSLQAGHLGQDEATFRSNENQTQDLSHSRALVSAGYRENDERTPNQSGFEHTGPSIEHDPHAIDHDVPVESHGHENLTTGLSEPQVRLQDAEEILEGSGNDEVSFTIPDVKGPESHQADETFHHSNDPIPETMAHGIDPVSMEKNVEDVAQLPAVEKDVQERDVDTNARSRTSSPVVPDHDADDVATRGADDYHGEPHFGLDQARHEPASVEDSSELERDYISGSTDVFDHAESINQPNPTNTSSPIATSPDREPTYQLEAHTYTPTYGQSPTDMVGHTQTGGIFEEAEKSSRSRAPTIVVSDDEDDNQQRQRQGSKSSVVQEALSSPKVGHAEPQVVGSQAAEAGYSYNSWSAETAARRPSTIVTEKFLDDDDPDEGLFAIPPTPREEVDAKAAQLLHSTSPLRIEVNNATPDANASVSREIGGTDAVSPDSDGAEETSTYGAMKESRKRDSGLRPLLLVGRVKGEVVAPPLADSGNLKRLSQDFTPDSGKPKRFSQNFTPFDDSGKPKVFSQDFTTDSGKSKRFSQDFTPFDDSGKPKRFSQDFTPFDDSVKPKRFSQDFKAVDDSENPKRSSQDFKPVNVEGAVAKNVFQWGSPAHIHHSSSQAVNEEQREDPNQEVFAAGENQGQYSDVYKDNIAPGHEAQSRRNEPVVQVVPETHEDHISPSIDVEPSRAAASDEILGYYAREIDTAQKVTMEDVRAAPEARVSSGHAHQVHSHQENAHGGYPFETGNASSDDESAHLGEYDSTTSYANQTQKPQYDPRMNSAEDSSHSSTSADESDDFPFTTPLETSKMHTSNYDGDEWGPSPTEERLESFEFPSTVGNDQSFTSPQHTTHQFDAHSSFSEPEAAVFSPGEDSTDFKTPTAVSGFDQHQLEHDEHVRRSGNFEHALGKLPDESAHTVQGTDDLFDDDSDERDNASNYGETIIEEREKIVYHGHGSGENDALGGNRYSGSFSHRSAGSRSSFASVREMTPLRPTEGSFISTSPTAVRADWAAEHEDEIRPQSQVSAAYEAGDGRGVAGSPWSPHAARPQTPPQAPRQTDGSPMTPSSATRRSTNPFRPQQTPQQVEAPDVDPDVFMPRDVTNTPWHARNDSIPASLHSQTTLESHQSSPIHSSLAADRHEPVIRDSWPAPAPGYDQYLSSWTGRPRGDSSISTNSNGADYDPFKAGTGGNGNKSSIYNPFQARSRAASAVSVAPTPAPAPAPTSASASASPARGSGIFNKMRSVFEQGAAGSGEAPPRPTRPVSGIYHTVAPLRSPARSEHRRSQDGPAQGDRSSY